MSNKKISSIELVSNRVAELRKLAFELCKDTRNKGQDTSAIDQMNMELQILLKEMPQAKEMHKEEIEVAWESGIDNCGEFNTPDISTGKQYYSQTFEP